MADNNTPPTTNSASCVDFPLFSQLPQELRLKIWKMTTEDSRVVLIQETVTLQRGRGFTSPTPIPAVLHACSEAREVALKNYLLCSPAHSDHGVVGLPARVYFNLHCDTVYYGKDWPSGAGRYRPCVHTFGGNEYRPNYLACSFGGYFLRETKETELSSSGDINTAYTGYWPGTHAPGLCCACRRRLLILWTKEILRNACQRSLRLGFRRRQDGYGSSGVSRVRVLREMSDCFFGSLVNGRH